MLSLVLKVGSGDPQRQAQEQVFSNWGSLKLKYTFRLIIFTVFYKQLPFQAIRPIPSVRPHIFNYPTIGFPCQVA